MNTVLDFKQPIDVRRFVVIYVILLSIHQGCLIHFYVWFINCIYSSIILVMILFNKFSLPPLVAQYSEL